MKSFLLSAILLLAFSTQCQPQKTTIVKHSTDEYVCGASRIEDYLPLLKDKRVGIIANQSSVIGETHLVDTLLSLGVHLQTIFTPEHGFRGSADAGATINSSKDEKTGIAIVSLYGKNKKPTQEQLSNIDILVFDLQDVGVRFYTYISTMTYIMEAAAENGLKVLVLDRPNPNGFFIDGPVLEPSNSSFVGLHRVPVAYGMTIGEYAMMVNGECWLKDSLNCDLTVIKLPQYDRNAIYELPAKPSPNLPNWQAIYLYPSLCFFEGTTASVGRGTDKPFQIYGHPDLVTDFQFTPRSKEGASKPKLEGLTCNGYDLTAFAEDYSQQQPQLHLEWLIEAYKQLKSKDFFIPYFRLLAGTESLQQQIEDGKSEDEIRASWLEDLKQFKKVRSKYLLYPDFE